MDERLERILQTVTKPARYTGGEWNSIVKDWDTCSVRWALAFPDIYEIGMSNLGLAILYDILNRQDGVLAERVYAPWTDMERSMRATGLPLFSLENRRPLAEFDSIESLYDAYRDRLRHYTRVSIAMDTLADTCLEEMVPDAFCSALVDDCVARGKTIKEGGAVYDVVSGLQSGVSNVANAFMALKTTVFDEQTLSPQEVTEALAADFKNPGGEVVRQRLLHAPKYGNDIDEVDVYVVRVMDDYLMEASEYYNTRHGRGPIGGGYAGSTSNISANVPLGSSVGATPDGRKAGEPINEGVSPVHGTDTGGPTKVLRSATKLPTIKSIAQLLNLRLSPSALVSEEGLRRLVTLLKGFRNLKAWHVQFNTVDTETLLDAQMHPEKYRDLVVRVAGYSALFVTLDKATQDDIIRRTVHELE